MIRNDLEYLISKAVNVEKAEYAVITGILVHNWGKEGTTAPTLEFVVPSSAYVVIGGIRTEMDLAKIPALTPRQIMILSSAGRNVPDLAGTFLKGTTVIETELKAPAARPQVRYQCFCFQNKLHHFLGISVGKRISFIAGSRINTYFNARTVFRRIGLDRVF